MFAFDWLLLLASVCVLIFLLGTTILLLINQMFLISKNTTKIELWHKHWATQDASAKGQYYKYPYDHGTFGNLAEFFGSKNILWWFIPSVPTYDGLHFPNLVPQLPYDV